MSTAIVPHEDLQPVVRLLRESVHAQDIAAILARADMHIGVTNRRTSRFYQQLAEMVVRMLSEPAVSVADYRAIEKMAVHLAHRIDEQDFQPAPVDKDYNIRQSSVYRISGELWRLGKACFKDSLTGERQ